MKKTKTLLLTGLALTLLLVSCAKATPSRTEREERRTQNTSAESTEDAPGEEPEEEIEEETENPEAEEPAKPSKEEIAAERDNDAIPAPDFTLNDQYGNTHTLSDYRGRVVFLNFWATWCPPCRGEMPDIQKLYEEYGDDGEVVILGIAGPGSVDDKDADGVAAFLAENGYTYPVAMDLTGALFEQYYIQAYPTTFMIDRDGNVFGYVQGMLTEEVMRDIIAQTLNG